MPIDTPPAHLFGWAGEDEAKRAWDDIGHTFASFFIVGDPEPYQPGGRYMLWEIARKVLGKDTPNYPQQVGDCVAFSAKNVIEHVACVEIHKGDTEEFKQIHPAYLYGTGRVLIGGGQLSGDGSVGSWQSKAAERYGVIPLLGPDIPAYAGSLSRKWGAPPGPPKELIERGKKNLIRTTAPLRNWEAMVMSVKHGFPWTISSNQGFEMKARSDGFNWPSGTWPHQMMCCGIDDDTRDPHACILNSWGAVHSQLKDLKTGEPWPIGTLRVRRAVIERMMNSGECISYSQFDGFQAQSELLWKSII